MALSNFKEFACFKRKEDILQHHKKTREKAKLNLKRKYDIKKQNFHLLNAEKEELQKAIDVTSILKHDDEVNIHDLKNKELVMKSAEEMTESNIQKLRKTKAVLDEERNLLQLQENAARSELEKSQIELKDWQNGFLKAISIYRKKLSHKIKIEKNECVRVEFEDILTSDRMPCHVRLKLVDTKWTLMDIEPDFPDSKKLAQQMEDTQDMQEFLVLVRKQFKIIVNEKEQKRKESMEIK